MGGARVLMTFYGYSFSGKFVWKDGGRRPVQFAKSGGIEERSIVKKIMKD